MSSGMLPFDENGNKKKSAKLREYKNLQKSFKADTFRTLVLVKNENANIPADYIVFDANKEGLEAFNKDARPVDTDLAVDSDTMNDSFITGDAAYDPSLDTSIEVPNICNILKPEIDLYKSIIQPSDNIYLWVIIGALLAAYICIICNVGRNVDLNKYAEPAMNDIIKHIKDHTRKDENEHLIQLINKLQTIAFSDDKDTCDSCLLTIYTNYYEFEATVSYFITNYYVEVNKTRPEELTAANSDVLLHRTKFDLSNADCTSSSLLSLFDTMIKSVSDIVVFYNNRCENLDGFDKFEPFLLNIATTLDRITTLEFTKANELVKSMKTEN